MSNRKPSPVEAMAAQSPRHKVFCRFLSLIADQFDKPHFYITGQCPLYVTRFKNVPLDYLKKVCHEYLLKDMPHYAPTLPQFADYLHGRSDFQPWYGQSTQSGYCKHCRTDDNGHIGGMRYIFYYGRLKDTGCIGERTFAVNCNCESGRKVSRAPMDLVMADLQATDPEAQVFIDYYCDHRQGKVTGRQQAPITKQRRLEAGTFVINEHGEEVPNFNHPLWFGATGYFMEIAYNVKRPERLQHKGTPATDAKNARINKRVQQLAAQHPNVSAPKSIGQLMAKAPDIIPADVVPQHRSQQNQSRPVVQQQFDWDSDPDNCPF